MTKMAPVVFHFLPLQTCIVIHIWTLFFAVSGKTYGLPSSQSSYFPSDNGVTSYEENYMCDKIVSDFEQCSRMNELKGHLTHKLHDSHNEMRHELHNLRHEFTMLLEVEKNKARADVKTQLRDEVRNDVRSELINELSNKILNISSSKEDHQRDHLGNVSNSCNE